MQGPDTLKLFAHLGMNSFANFPVDRAKQLAPTSYDGHVIGDGILFHLEKDHMVFVGRAPAASTSVTYTMAAFASPTATLARVALASGPRVIWLSGTIVWFNDNTDAA